ncbi:MAG: MMPL family transporter [Cellvibrionaceae bacterium]
MGQAIVKFATDRPKLIFGLLVAFVVILGSQIARIQVDTDPENMLPATQPERVLHNETKEKFGLWDNIVVGVVNQSHSNGIYNEQSLSELHQLARGIEAIEGVITPDLMSLAHVDNITQEGAGAIRFSWMMNEAPQTAQASADIQQAVARLPLLQNTLVSGDGKAAGIYVPIVEKHESYRIANEVRELITALDTRNGLQENEYHITGLPVAEDTFGVEMFVQMAISAPLAALVIYLLMWWFFRSASMVTAPMLMAMATVIATMGLLIGTGNTVHIMSSMIPIFLMPIAVVDSVHVLSEFVDRYRPGDDPKALIQKIMGHLFKPMLFTSLTSSVGFASLAFTPIPPVQVFGLFVAFGILLAFFLTLVFIPAWIVNMKPERLAMLRAHRNHHDDHGPLANIVRACGKASVKGYIGVMVAAIAVSIVSYQGITKIEINDNPVRWFEEQHEIRVADKVLNEHFAGTYNAFLVLEKTRDNTGSAVLAEALGKLSISEEMRTQWFEMLNAEQGLQELVNAVDEALFTAEDEQIESLEDFLMKVEEVQTSGKYFQSPEALTYIESLQAALQSSGYVGKSNSVADLVKTVYRELRGGDEANYHLPESASGVAQTLLSYQSSHRPQDLWHMVTPDLGSAVIWLQLKSGDNQDMSKVIEFVDSWQAQNPAPIGVKTHWAGLTYINVVWQEAMVSGMLDSLISAFFVVLLIMILLFRSVVFGLLAMLPLSLTIGFIYGMIGWIGKDYDMPIAVLSALTLGLSVDFAIHFLQRLRELVKEKGSWHAAIEEMYEEPGRAISRNAIVIAVGFTPLLAAPLVPYQTVGMFLATIMAVSCVVTLSLLPAIIHLFHRWIFRN